MKKTLVLVAFMLINLITTAYADQAAQVKQRVEFIYNTVFSAYTNRDVNVPIPNFYEKFCSQELNKTMSKAMKIEVYDVPIIDMDYWYMGQDFNDKLHIKNVKVISVSGNKATVKIIINNYEDIPITLKLVFERGDWFIDDFDDLKESLKTDIREYSKSN